MSRTARYVDGVLIISHGGKPTPYTVTDVKQHPDVAFLAFELTKADGQTYHVSVNEFGAVCDCADCNYRNRPCKHILAMQAVELLPRSLHGYHESASEEAKEDAERDGD